MQPKKKSQSANYFMSFCNDWTFRKCAGIFVTLLNESIKLCARLLAFIYTRSQFIWICIYYHSVQYKSCKVSVCVIRFLLLSFSFVVVVYCRFWSSSFYCRLAFLSLCAANDMIRSSWSFLFLFHSFISDNFYGRICGRFGRKEKHFEKTRTEKKRFITKTKGEKSFIRIGKGCVHWWTIKPFEHCLNVSEKNAQHNPFAQCLDVYRPFRENVENP